MISQRSALRIFAALPSSICGNPQLLKSSTIESRRNANMRWPPKQPHLDGRLSKLSLSTKILVFPDPVSWRAMALPDLHPGEYLAPSSVRPLATGNACLRALVHWTRCDYRRAAWLFRNPCCALFSQAPYRSLAGPSIQDESRLDVPATGRWSRFEW